MNGSNRLEDIFFSELDWKIFFSDSANNSPTSSLAQNMGSRSPRAAPYLRDVMKTRANIGKTPNAPKKPREPRVEEAVEETTVEELQQRVNELEKLLKEAEDETEVYRVYKTMAEDAEVFVEVAEKKYEAINVYRRRADKAEKGRIKAEENADVYKTRNQEVQRRCAEIKNRTYIEIKESRRQAEVYKQKARTAEYIAEVYKKRAEFAEDNLEGYKKRAEEAEDNAEIYKKRAEEAKDNVIYKTRVEYREEVQDEVEEKRDEVEVEQNFWCKVRDFF